MVTLTPTTVRRESIDDLRTLGCDLSASNVAFYLQAKKTTTLWQRIKRSVCGYRRKRMKNNAHQSCDFH